MLGIEVPHTCLWEDIREYSLIHKPRINYLTDMVFVLILVKELLFVEVFFEENNNFHSCIIYTVTISITVLKNKAIFARKGAQD